MEYLNMKYYNTEVRIFAPLCIFLQNWKFLIKKHKLNTNGC